VRRLAAPRRTTSPGLTSKIETAPGQIYRGNPMLGIGAFEAKNRLSELLRRAEGGEEIAITHCGRIVARLVPPLPALDREAARAAAARIRVRRKGVTLGNLKIEDLVAEGRR